MVRLVLLFLAFAPLLSSASIIRMPNCFQAPGHLYGSFKIQVKDTSYNQFQLMGRKFLYAGFEIQAQDFNGNTLIVRRYPQLNKLSDHQIRSTFTLFKSLAHQGEIKRINCVKELP